MRNTLHRWLAVIVCGLLPVLASAGIPKNNKAGDFWKDQWIAADRFMLPPHVWSFIIMGIALLGTASFVYRSYRRPAAIASPTAPDWSADKARTYRRWALFGFFALYALGFNNTFSVYDDPQNIWLNDVVTEPGWDSLREIIFENHRGVNQEWMFLSLHISYQIFGKNYAGFFLMNWLMFPLLLSLVYRIAWQLFDNHRVALLSMAFMGFSPIVAELVCWMLERGHYFGLTFALCSVTAYLSYIKSLGTMQDGLTFDPAAPRWKAWLGLHDGVSTSAYLRRFGLYALAVLAFASSQFGKPIFIYVPLWLVFLDVFMRRRDWLLAIVDKLPIFAVGAAFLYKAVSNGDDHGRVNEELIGGSLSNTLALNANHVLEYIHSAFHPFPTGLRTPWNEPENWFWVKGIPDIMVHGFSPIASLIILLCLATVGLVLALRYRWGMLLLAGCGAVVSVGPVSNMPVHTVVHAYRYTLSMNVLISICLGAAAIHLYYNTPREWVRKVVPVATIAWLTLGAYHTVGNIRAWHEPVDLWTRSADVLYPNDGWSHYYAGKTLQHKRRYDEALAHEHIAIRRIPANSMANRRIGDAYYGLEDFEHAAEYWEKYFGRRRNKITASYARKLAEVGLYDLIPAKYHDEIEWPDTEADTGTGSDAGSERARPPVGTPQPMQAPERLQRAIREARDLERRRRGMRPEAPAPAEPEDDGGDE